MEAEDLPPGAELVAGGEDLPPGAVAVDEDLPPGAEPVVEETAPAPVEREDDGAAGRLAAQVNAADQAETDRLDFMLKDALAWRPVANLDRAAQVRQLAKGVQIDEATADKFFDSLSASWEASGYDAARWRRDNPEQAALLLRKPEVARIVLKDPGVSKLVQAFRAVGKLLSPGVDEHFVAPTYDSPAVHKGPAAPPPPEKTEDELFNAEREASEKPGYVEPRVAQVENAKTRWLDEQDDVTRAVVIAAQRGKEASAGLEISRGYKDLMLMRMGQPGADAFAAAMATGKLADLKEKERQNVPLALGESEGEQTITDSMNGLVSSFDVAGEAVKNVSAWGLVASALGAAGGALLTKTPQGAYAGAAKMLAATGAAGAAKGTFDLEAGDYYRQALTEKTDDGRPLTNEEATAGAVAYGALATVIELGEWSYVTGPIRELFQKGGKAAVKAEFRRLAKADPGFRALLRRAFPAVQQVMRGGVGEALEEGLQSSTQDAIGYFVRSYSAGKLQQGPVVDVEKALTASGAALAPGVLLGGATYGLELSIRAVQTEENELDPEKVAALAAAAETSPTAVADPEGLAEVVAMASGRSGKPVRSVHVSTEGLVRLFQGRKEDPEQGIEKVLGEDGNRVLQEAITTGQKYIEVPVETYLERWGKNGLAKALLDETVTDPAFRTPRELRESKAEVDAGAAEVEERAKPAEKDEARAEALQARIDQFVADVEAIPVKGARAFARDARIILSKVAETTPELLDPENMDLRARPAFDDTSFAFSSGPDEDPLAMARQTVEAYRNPEKKAWGEKWLEHVEGKAPYPKGIPDEVVKQLAAEGAWPAGEAWPFGEDGRYNAPNRSLGEKSKRSGGVSGEAGAKRQPAALRAFRLPDLAYSEAYGRYDQPAVERPEVARVREAFGKAPRAEQMGAYFLNRNTGLLNERGFETAPRPADRPLLAEWELEGNKPLNEFFGHEALDAALRAVGQVLVEKVPVAGKYGASLRGWVKSEAEAKEVAAAMQTAISTLAGETLQVSTATVPAQEKLAGGLAAVDQAHKALKKTAVAGRKFGPRKALPAAFMTEEFWGVNWEDKAAVESPATQQALKAAAEKMRPAVERIKKAAKASRAVAVGPEHAARFDADPRAFDTIHFQPTGLLTEEGIEALEAELKPDMYGSADMRELQATNSAFSPAEDGDQAGANVVLGQLAEGLGAISQGRVFVGNTHGDEFKIISKGVAKQELERMLDAVQTRLDQRLFWRDLGGGRVAVQVGVHFAYGLGETFDHADRVDLPERKSRQRGVPRAMVVDAPGARRIREAAEGAGFLTVDVGERIGRGSDGRPGHQPGQEVGRTRLEQSKRDKKRMGGLPTARESLDVIHAMLVWEDWMKDHGARPLSEEDVESEMEAREIARVVEVARGRGMEATPVPVEQRPYFLRGRETWRLEGHDDARTRNGNALYLARDFGKFSVHSWSAAEQALNFVANGTTADAALANGAIGAPQKGGSDAGRARLAQEANAKQGGIEGDFHYTYRTETEDIFKRTAVDALEERGIPVQVVGPSADYMDEAWEIPAELLKETRPGYTYALINSSETDDWVLHERIYTEDGDAIEDVLASANEPGALLDKVLAKPLSTPTIPPPTFETAKERHQVEEWLRKELADPNRLYQTDPEEAAKRAELAQLAQDQLAGRPVDVEKLKALRQFFTEKAGAATREANEAANAAMDEMRAAVAKHGKDSAEAKAAREKFKQANARQAAAYAALDKTRLLAGEQDPEGPRGATDFFVEGRRRIYEVLLSENADASTVPHELAHVFLEQMVEVTRRGIAQPRVQEDLRTLLQWGGLAEGNVTEWDALTNEGRKAIHEKTATAFEAYLREGKPPAPGLMRLFTRMKLWLLDLYKDVRKLGGVPPKAITDVFDRLLATEEELKAERAKVGRRPMFNNPTEAGMSPEQWAEYLAAQAEAFAMGNVKAEQRALKDAHRATEAWWKEKERELREAATAEYDTLPARVAKQAMKAQGIKLSHADVVKMIGAEAAEKVPTIELGTHPNDAVEFFTGADGQQLFATGEQLVEAIATLPPKAQWVKNTVATRMAEQYPDVLDARTELRAEIQKGLHGDYDFRWLKLQWDTLRKRAGLQPLPLESVKQAAQKLVDARRIGKLNVGQTLAAERAAANRAIEAAAEQNWPLAHIEQERQLLNMFLWRALSEARDERDAFVKRAEAASKLAARARLGKAHPLYRDGVDLLLETFELKAPEQRDVDLPRIGQVVAQMQADGATVGLDEAVLERLLAKPKKWQQLSLTEMRAIDAALRNIQGAARTKATVLLDGKREDKADVVLAIAAEARKNLTSKGVRDPEALTGPQKIGHAWNLYSGMALRPETMLSEMVGGDSLDSMAHRAMVKPLLDARAKEAELLDEHLKPVLEAWTKIPAAVRKTFDDPIDGAALFPEHTEGAEGNIAPPRFRHQLLMMALHAGTQSSFDRLTQGRNITEAQLRTALDLLTKEELDWVQSVWDSLDSLWPLARALEERDSGLAPPKLEHRPLVTKHGAYRGGYFPAVYTSDEMAGQRQEANAVNDLLDASFTRPGTARSHLKRRVEGFSGILSLNPAQMPRAFAQVVHDIAFREAVKSVGGLVLDTDLRKVLVDRLGKGRTATLLQWVKDVGQMRGQEGIEGIAAVVHIARFAKAGQVISALGYSAQTALGDLSGVLQAVPRTDLKSAYLASGIAQALAPGASDIIEAKSKAISARRNQIFQDLQRQVGEITSSGLLSRGPMRWLREHAFAFAEWTDRYTSNAIWKGRYDQGIAAGETEERAIEAADAVVRRTLPSHSVVDLPALLRNHGLLGALTIFQGYWLTQWNGVAAIAQPLFRPGSGKWAKARVPGRLLAYLTAGAVLSELLSGRGPEGEDEDWKTLGGWGRWYARKLIAGTLAMFPAGGEMLAGWFEADLLNKKPNVRAQGIYQLGESTYNALMKAADEDRENDDRLKNALRAVGPWARIPSNQMVRTGGYLWDLYEGDVRPNTPIGGAGGVVYGEREAANLPKMLDELLQ